jgi:hypothetical protein
VETIRQDIHVQKTGWLDGRTETMAIAAAD